MQLAELDFDLPADLIAQCPAEPRDSCRLMWLPRQGGWEHRHFNELPGLLRPADTLVLNDSRVLPARMEARKASGGKVELLFLRPVLPSAETLAGSIWEVLARPSHRLRPGAPLYLPGGETLWLQRSLGEGKWTVQADPGLSVIALMETYGILPLPPYIHEQPDDPNSYQTIYASQPGSAAAPTAGLHFTRELLNKLAARGITLAYVTLHVGLDTFQPIREELVEAHRIHCETYSVPATTLEALRQTRARKGRVIAVGTTATRVLETLAQTKAMKTAAASNDIRERHSKEPAMRTELGPVHLDDRGGLEGETRLFITPGYRFQMVDGLLTNFHLPKSSVLALAMAFAGPERLRAAYEEAIRLRYRFFSFGDAMFIEGKPADIARA